MTLTIEYLQLALGEAIEEARERGLSLLEAAVIVADRRGVPALAPAIRVYAFGHTLAEAQRQFDLRAAIGKRP